MEYLRNLLDLQPDLNRLHYLSHHCKHHHTYKNIAVNSRTHPDRHGRHGNHRNASHLNDENVFRNVPFPIVR